MPVVIFTDGCVNVIGFQLCTPHVCVCMYVCMYVKVKVQILMKYKWYFMPQFVVQCAAYEKICKV